MAASCTICELNLNILTVPGARWEQWVWTSHPLWCPPPTGRFLHQKSPRAHICTHAHRALKCEAKA